MATDSLTFSHQYGDREKETNEKKNAKAQAVKKKKCIEACEAVTITEQLSWVCLNSVLMMHIISLMV